MTLKMAAPGSLTVPSRPVVYMPHCISFMCGKEEVGRISARFDFSEVPPGLHTTGLQMVGQGRTLYLPVGWRLAAWQKG